MAEILANSESSSIPLDLLKTVAEVLSPKYWDNDLFDEIADDLVSGTMALQAVKARGEDASVLLALSGHPQSE